jgi:hypothetical protein
MNKSSINDQDGSINDQDGKAFVSENKNHSDDEEKNFGNI